MYLYLSQDSEFLMLIGLKLVLESKVRIGALSLLSKSAELKIFFEVGKSFCELSKVIC